MLKKKFWLTLVLVVLLLGTSWWFRGRRIVEEKREEAEEEQVEIKETGRISLILDFGEGKISTYSADINLAKPVTVLAVLERLSTENDFSLVTKESDFGVFVEEISGVKNSQKQFWLFYVNGQMAQLSADKLELKNGDLVEWKYEEFE